MLSTVDRDTFQTQECNSTWLARVLRLRKNQQWVIEGFTFSHWHQCSLPFASVTFEGSLLRLGCVCLSHPLVLDASHLGFSSDQTTVQRPPGTSQRLSKHTAAMALVCKCPFRVSSNTCLFTELGERWYWSDNSLGGSLWGQSRWNHLAKAWGCPHHYWLRPQAELWGLLSINLLGCNRLFSLKAEPLVSCPNREVAYLHLLVYLYSQNL